jgi:hypothetical protein
MMKTGWVIVIAIGCLLLGGFGGMMIGGVGGAAGGTIVGVCYATRVAVKEGLLTSEQSSQLLNAIGTKYAASSSKVNLAGNLEQACRQMPQS